VFIRTFRLAARAGFHLAQVSPSEYPNRIGNAAMYFYIPWPQPDEFLVANASRHDATPVLTQVV
jgi:hypothetical protein